MNFFVMKLKNQSKTIPGIKSFNKQTVQTRLFAKKSSNWDILTCTRYQNMEKSTEITDKTVQNSFHDLQPTRLHTTHKHTCEYNMT